MCVDAGPGLDEGCTGFVMGLFSAALWLNSTPAEQGGLAHKFCPPEDPDIVQIQDLVVQYVTNNADIRHYPAEVVTLMALWTAFPCTQ